MLKLSSSIKFVVSDFDGVMTDGSLYLDENLNEQKRVNFSDIMGIYLLKRAGYEFGIITGEDSKIIDYLTKKINITEIHKNVRKKGEVLKGIMDKYNLKSDEVLYVGDDVNDIPAFELVKYKIAPKNANYKVKEIKDIQITEHKGGDGAIREIVDSILMAE